MLYPPRPRTRPARRQRRTEVFALVACAAGGCEASHDELSRDLDLELRDADSDSPAPQADEGGADTVVKNCGGTLERPAVELSWDELPTPAAEVSEVHSLAVTAVNNAAEDVIVDEIHATGDAAGVALDVEFSGFVVAADQQGSFLVELDALSIDRPKMQTSGVLVLEASLSRLHSDSDSLGHLRSSTRYLCRVLG